MEATPVIARIFTPHEATQLFSHLDQLEIEYHKPYLRFNKPVKVPRGQASFTLDDTIHYSYKAAGGSPPNRVMDETLRTITARVNEALGTRFNTILMNVYRSGDDCFAFHRDSTDGWVPGSGFATLSFGAVRDFQLRSNETGVVTTFAHEPGVIIYMPHPMNDHFTHGIPKRKRVSECRISLTFREIAKT